MTNNDFAISNLEIMAHNVSAYASYCDRSGDLFGEIDDAVENAERALLDLVKIIKETNKKMEG